MKDAQVPPRDEILKAKLQAIVHELPTAPTWQAALAKLRATSANEDCWPPTRPSATAVTCRPNTELSTAGTWKSGINFIWMSCSPVARASSPRRFARIVESTIHGSKLAANFDSLDHVGWNALGLNDEHGPYVSFEGAFRGQAVCLRLLARA